MKKPINTFKKPKNFKPNLTAFHQFIFNFVDPNIWGNSQRFFRNNIGYNLNDTIIHQLSKKSINQTLALSGEHNFNSTTYCRLKLKRKSTKAHLLATIETKQNFLYTLIAIKHYTHFFASTLIVKTILLRMI